MTERVLVVSSTFPQYHGDPRGRFLCRHWERHVHAGARVRVLVPRTKWVDGSLCSSLEVVRFVYAPQRHSTLTGRFGMLENIREWPGRAVWLPSFWHALGRSLAQQIEVFRPHRVVAHMLLPNGWHVARQCTARNIPFDLYGHGTDVDLMLCWAKLQPQPWARFMQRARQVYLPSQEKVRRVQAVFGQRIAGSSLAVQTMAHAVEPSISAPGLVCSRESTAGGLPDDRDSNARPMVLFMGRLIRQKGVDTLLHALAGLNETVDVVVAGDGPERKRLEKLARTLRLFVRFVGYVQGPERDELYRRAAVLCVPSRELGSLSEGSPLVVLEAREHGLAIVASHVGGIPELCRGYDKALLVAPDQAHALAQGIDEMLRRRQLAASCERASSGRAA